MSRGRRSSSWSATAATGTSPAASSPPERQGPTNARRCSATVASRTRSRRSHSASGPPALRCLRTIASSPLSSWKAVIARSAGRPPTCRAHRRARRRSPPSASIATSAGVNHPLIP
ncbi:hypothetical protein [Ornithinimicrobium kibberense]|uniref:hypothetical protein n=1 Tax=Ornithinimicrobium kibberense TaxID=282060 RepID=UPI00360C6BF7